jgi:ribosomal-protein-alanine N-acetyltransferase
MPSPPTRDDRKFSDWRRGLPQLTGELVSLREVAIADAPALCELLTDPLVTAHISPPPPSVSAFEGFIIWAHRERTLGTSVCFAVVPHGLDQAVGIIQIRTLDPTFVVAEWGFAVGAAFWGTGVFPEAATLAADFAFDVLRVYRLEARVTASNGRGNGAVQKVGGCAEAVLARAFKRQSGFDEQLLWSLLADERQSTRAAIRERFAADSARRSIHEAIAAVTERLRLSQRSADDPLPTLHPFFVTDHQPKPDKPS